MCAPRPRQGRAYFVYSSFVFFCGVPRSSSQGWVTRVSGLPFRRSRGLLASSMGGLHQATGQDDKRGSAGGHFSLTMRLQGMWVSENGGATHHVTRSFGVERYTCKFLHESRRALRSTTRFCCFSPCTRVFGTTPGKWRICLRRCGLAGGG